jgi:hypothetical protein
MKGMLPEKAFGSNRCAEFFPNKNLFCFQAIRIFCVREMTVWVDRIVEF